MHASGCRRKHMSTWGGAGRREPHLHLLGRGRPLAPSRQRCQQRQEAGGRRLLRRQQRVKVALRGGLAPASLLLSLQRLCLLLLLLLLLAGAPARTAGCWRWLVGEGGRRGGGLAAPAAPTAACAPVLGLQASQKGGAGSDAQRRHRSQQVHQR